MNILHCYSILNVIKSVCVCVCVRVRVCLHLYHVPLCFSAALTKCNIWRRLRELSFR